MKTTRKMETCDIERCIVYYLKKMLTTPHLYSHSKTDPKPEVLSEIEFEVMGEMNAVRGITHAHMCRKADIFRQRRLSI